MNIQLDEGAYFPLRAYVLDGGADLRTPHRFVLHPQSYIDIDTGVHFEIPYGLAGLVIGKSSLSKEGITTESLIDSGYTGSIHVVLFNHSRKLRVFEKGDKIAQIMFSDICPGGSNNRRRSWRSRLREHGEIGERRNHGNEI